MIRCILFIFFQIISINYCFINAELPVVIPRVENIISVPRDTSISYRLPNNTKPLHYNISIRTNVDSEIDKFNFTGRVQIDISILELTNIITVHQRQLNISKVELKTNELNPIQMDITETMYNSDTEFLQIFSSEVLNPDTIYTLIIEYAGILRTDDAGFYRSSYINDAGDTTYLATTQFESTDARHGFPCYDEPALKATFIIEITHGPKYHAISNMDYEIIRENEDETKTTIFKQTPLMSTYLIAYIISDFEFIEQFDSSHNVNHRSFARPNAIHKLPLSLDVGIRILQELSDYLQVNYSISKIDQVAIPNFAAGAMENWGLVTYRETQFLYDENVDTHVTKLNAVSTIAHEYVHQWFGNLISPMWWTYLWLNEGFATLYASYATDLVYPDWHLMDYFVSNTLQSVFESDALLASRPMSHYIESPQEISRIFDNIAYSKSGSVLRMFLNAFTDASFKKGLTRYLTNMEYAAATEDDLFAALEEATKDDGTIASDLNVATIMKSWTIQSGYPVLYVLRNYLDGSIRIGQERYLTYPTSTTSDNTYWIPLTYTTANISDFSNTHAIDWLPQNVRSKRIVPTEILSWSKDEWVIFNLQHSGYYRVQYDRHNWDLITYDLYVNDFKRIHQLSRSQLINDAFTFARGNTLPWEVPLNLIRYLKNETEYVPWASAVRHINYLSRYISGNNNYELFREYIRNLTENYFTALGINDISNESWLNKFSRILMINLSCTMGSQNCRTLTNNHIKAWIRGEATIHQNVRDIIFCAGLRNADANDFNQIWESMINNLDGNQNRLLNAMGCMSDEDLLNQYLNRMLDNNLNSTIKNNIFSGVYQNSLEGLQISIRFMIEHLENIESIFTSMNNVETAILGLSQRSTNEEIHTEFLSLLDAIFNMPNITDNIKDRVNQNILDMLSWKTANKDHLDNIILTLNEPLEPPITIPPTESTTELPTTTTTTTPTQTGTQPPISTQTPTGAPGIASTINISIFLLSFAIIKLVL